MSGNLPFLHYSRLKTFFNATIYKRNLLWGVTQYITCFTIQPINNQRNKMVTESLFTNTFVYSYALKTVFVLLKWWLTFRSTTCGVRCGDQQLRCTHCTYGLFQFGSAASPWNTSYSCWRWRYLFLEAVVELRRKGYAMESDVEEYDLNKGDEQLFLYLELRHTERSCRCISKSVLNHFERHMNEARISSER